MRGYTAKVGLRKPEVLPKWRDMAGIYARVKRLWSIYDDAVAAGDVDTAERARGDINEALGFDREWRTRFYPDIEEEPLVIVVNDDDDVCGVER